MLSCWKTCWLSVYQRAKAALFDMERWKRRKQQRSSSFDTVTSLSTFGAMEVSSQLRQVFKVMDANGDGKISSLELRHVLLCLGHEKSTASKAAEGMIREIDFNGDGFIDLDEFMHALNYRSVDEDEDEEEEDHLIDAFNIFDRDNDGLISAEELRRVLTRLGFNKCSLKECKRMIKGVDKDGDGFVDFNEFRSMMAAPSLN